MCESVDHQGMEAWVANHDFISTLASRIAVDGGLDIAGKKIRNRRELRDDFGGNGLARVRAFWRTWFGKAGDRPVDQAEELLLEFLERRFGDPVGSRSR